MHPQRLEVFSVPLRTVSSLTPRDELSSRIKQNLQNISPTVSGVPRILILHGLGGIGKTQLALKFVEDHKKDFSPILWIDADSQDSVRASFERCARALGLEIDKTSGQGVRLREAPAIEAVLNWFQRQYASSTEWLVVIDGADDTTGWNIEDIIPQGGKGSLIITSQFYQPPKLLKTPCSKIEVEKMIKAEAIRLLLQDLECDMESLPSEVQKAAHHILELLDGFPLVIDLARAYLAMQPHREAALKQYSIDLARHKDELFSSGPRYELSSYQKTLWTVWDTTFAAIEKRFPGSNASLMLTFLSYCDHANVQRELFRLASMGLPQLPEPLQMLAECSPEWFKKWITRDGQTWDSFFHDKSIEPLVSYALLQRVEGDWPGVTMHSLVQWRAKKQHIDEPWHDCLLVFMSAAALQISENQDQPRFRRHIPPHIATLRYQLQQRQKVQGLDEPQISSISILAKLLHAEGLWLDTELQLEVMENKKRILGLEHPDTMASIIDLASTYSNQGRWPEAGELQMQLMETCKRILGPEHPDTLGSINNLAGTYSKQGRWPEAEELQMQVMETTKRILGLEHPDTLTSINNLASTYLEQERWPEAEELQMQVMEIRKRILGLEHPDTLGSINNLAGTYSEQGRWPEAEELQMQVMETSKRILGPEHPNTLASIENLASTYSRQGRWPEAKELLLQVIEKKKINTRA